MEIGAVSTSNKLATEAAFKIMKNGGNAFDAAVCAAAVLGVTEPSASGLGGGGMWLLKKGDSDEIVMIDGREESPQFTDPKIYKGNAGRAKIGAYSCAIPGHPAALTHINKNYGSLPLLDCLEDAIKYAEKGYPVDADYQRHLNARIDIVKKFKEISNIFLLNGNTPPIGHTIIQKDLANTLRTLGKNGHDGFYKGPVGEMLLKGVNNHGGFWTYDDLANYQVKIKKPLKMTYHDATINTLNSPSSGGAQLFLMLKIIDEIENRLQPKTYTDEIHLLVEAMYKSYYYRREYLSDCPDISHHISDKNLELLTKDINLDFIDRPIKQCKEKEAHSEQTTHISIIDRFGNCVSATMSINWQFGSCVVPDGTGVVLNDQMSDFSMISSSPNYIGPRKRPLSNMTPCIIETDDFIYLIGTPGGMRISTMVFLAVLFIVNNPEMAESAVDLPRFHQQYYPDFIEIEPDIFPKLLIENLQKKGHRIVNVNRRYGNMQLVIYDKKKKRAFAVTDKRYYGHALSG